jgi:hypothetical protein
MRLLGALFLFVGVGLGASPWWSATLAPSDRPLVVLLAVIFGGAGLFMSIPEDRAPRLRTFAFCAWMAAFGVACAAIALAPFHADADGFLAIAGVPRVLATPPPWWARIVAGGFAVLLLGVAGAGLWGLVRGALRRAPP